MKRFEFAAFFAFAVLSALAFPNTETGPNVTVLNDATFDDRITATPNMKWFVLFFSPYCPHCQRVQPTWQDLAEKLGDDKVIEIAGVNCVENGELNNRFVEVGYPTIKLFHQNKVYEYSGPRDVGSFEQFVKTGYTSVEGKPFPAKATLRKENNPFVSRKTYQFPREGGFFWKLTQALRATSQSRVNNNQLMHPQ